MIETMTAYLDRLLRKWEDSTGGLPKAPWDPDVDPTFWQGPPDEEEWAPWRPLEKTVEHDLDALAPDLSPWPEAIRTYVNSYWFAPLDGQVGDLQVTLMAVLPGQETDNLLLAARGYAANREGPRQIPIGVEFNGLQVVVAADGGVVSLDDWERDRLRPIAEDLEELFRRMKP